jgi:glycosyltransferase involved in cell wall biosynthesis
LPAHQREKLILFAGRVVHEKAPDAFIAACAAALPRLPGWRAEVIGADGFVAGAPDSSFISALRPAAAAAGVAMLGLHTHTDVLAAMARAAIVVVPSRWAEPFGLAALEAMACGAAVACSNRGGLAEVTGDAAVPIDPDNPAAMANALVSLAQDPARRAELSARGIARVDACFSTAAAIARLDALRDRVWRAG